MKRNKRGISLVTLVITIIVMTIITGVIIFTLSDSGVFDKANEAVNATNLNQVQQLASLAWGEAYLDKLKDDSVNLEQRVLDALEDSNVDMSKYTVEVTAGGVKVSLKAKEGTLGALLTSGKMYGTKINYEANGVTDWKVFYSQTVNGEKYVYLIASEELAYSAYYDGNGELTDLGTKLTNIGATISSGTVELGPDNTRTVGQVYWSSSSTVPTNVATIQNHKLWMAEWGNYDSYSTNENGRCVSYFLDENIWSDFANTEEYVDANGESYVVGAIGTPTAEMFVASWNAKRLTETNTSKVKLTLTANGTNGYYVNGSITQSISTSDPLYIWSTAFNSTVWLASPAGLTASDLLYALPSGFVDGCNYGGSNLGVRPVVCLKANIPASIVDGNIVIK